MDCFIPFLYSASAELPIPHLSFASALRKDTSAGVIIIPGNLSFLLKVAESTLEIRLPLIWFS
ncbi:hypothetical protein D3C87_1662590 [compost metagenome]